jgi:hypothetical protein
MYRKALVVTFSLLTLIVSFLITNRAFAQTDACVEGYVWREAFPDDHVCVSRFELSGGCPFGQDRKR